MKPLIVYITIVLAVLSAQDSVWPTDGGRSLKSNFGEFRHHHFHMGIDIKTGGKEGVSVYSVSDGYVSRMVTNFKGFGRALYIVHLDGTTSVYAHLSQFNPKLEGLLKYDQNKNESYILNHYFKPNEIQVKKGEWIGYTGNTGHSYGPHLHFELRNSLEQPVNPQTNGFSVDDHSPPIIEQLAMIPLSGESRVNGSMLPVSIPLFRNKSGIYEFADTLNIFGPVGFALKVKDKRQGFSETYQINSIDLMIDGLKEYSLNYRYLDYNTTDRVQLVRNHYLYRLNLGSFQNLFHIDKKIKSKVQFDNSDGQIQLSAGYHPILISVKDANDNTAIAKGIIFNHPPTDLVLLDVEQRGNELIFNIQPKFINIPLKRITCYSFSSAGFADNLINPKSVKKADDGFLVTLDKRMIRDRSLQFIARNEMGAYSAPLNWHPQNVLVDYNATPEIDIRQTPAGVMIQVETGNLGTSTPKLTLEFTDNLKQLFMFQIQPFTYLSAPLPVNFFSNIKSINTSLNMATETIYHYKFEPAVINPGQSEVAFSKDKMCSLQTLKTSFYEPTLVWIDIVSNSVPPAHGEFLSKVYQLQPFNIPLQDTVNIGIRYDKKLAEMSKMNLYYYNQKEGWTFIPSKNSRKRNVLTGSISSLEAVCILQDSISPVIQSTFPENGGLYYANDVTHLHANVNDALSGIEPSEFSMKMIVDGKRVWAAFQPVDQIISYDLLDPLRAGNHVMSIWVRDRAGNDVRRNIDFIIK